MMNNLLVRGFVAWFNDGKRITAVVLIAMQWLAKWAESKGYPLPEGLADSTAGYIGGAVFAALSKADVRLPTAAQPPATP